MSRRAGIESRQRTVFGPNPSHIIAPSSKRGAMYIDLMWPIRGTVIEAQAAPTASKMVMIVKKRPTC